MKKFNLDRDNAMFLGVCAGIADFTGINATAVRIISIVFTLVGGFPWTFIAYGAIAWAANPKDRPWGSSLPKRGMNDFDDSDRRRVEVDTYVASQDSKLAREIEALRNS